MLPILFFIFAYLASVGGTIVGFGASTLFLPLALFFVDFTTALTLTALLHIFYSLGRVTFFWKHLDRKMVLIFGAPAVLLSIVGASLVGYTPQDLLKALLGAFLVLLAIAGFFKPHLKVEPNKVNAFVAGGISGLLTGLIGTGGAFRVAAFASFDMKKLTFIATSAAITFFVDLARIPVYIQSGFLPESHYVDVIGLVIVAFLGALTGKAFVDKIPQDIFKKMILLAIALIGLKFVIDFFV